ncbi:thiamine biosynthetic bifunctional enzyme Thi4 [Fistulina hepatica ATCC 64428]|uniref:Thiamine biosynthetic bifunctional enzyme Thi4 n=1 Tax=Fistulina hepatica ATCC 64428 TaxID=1128425 RepID=A0A0D6ZZK3_9AGAR|nr:thiamine biosynthetic bifunctional enzyme Thi4 [Fistulina hepatica ATCC 64428]
MVAHSNIDYSLYLVTSRDTGILSPSNDYFHILEQALIGGVTIVQIREKDADTGEFIEVARKSKEICDRYKVPILINDRIDIALAIGAHGVHVGQKDMPVTTARRLLPKNSIVGIGSVWGTRTKKLTNPIVGVRGVGSILRILDGTDIKAVAIGGVKRANLLRTLHGAVSPTNHPLDGVAIVSDIMGAEDPRARCEALSTTLREFRDAFSSSSTSAFRPSTLTDNWSTDSIKHGVGELMQVLRASNPLVHQITNSVVTTQSANITLAVGGSPIMATTPEEMEDLAKYPGALLINIGTLTTENLDGMFKAGFFANVNKKPLVCDPVGVGATQFRKGTVSELLSTWQASVIKGNAGELAALAGSSEVDAKGVDSAGSFEDPIKFVKNLARRERCVIVLTGVTDYVSDGDRVVLLKNGHEMLGRITGSGCMLGSCIASFCGAAASVGEDLAVGRLVRGDMFLGAIAGILVLTIASERAVARNDVKGPGTFLPALIDEAAALKPEDIIDAAKIELA